MGVLAAMEDNDMIRPCTCRHEGQDRLYGRSNRVWNRTEQNKPEAERKWRCTVCGRVEA